MVNTKKVDFSSSSPGPAYFAKKNALIYPLVSIFIGSVGVAVGFDLSHTLAYAVGASICVVGILCAYCTWHKMRQTLQKEPAIQKPQKPQKSQKNTHRVRFAPDIVFFDIPKHSFPRISSPSEKLQTTPLTSPLSSESVNGASSSQSTTSALNSATTSSVLPSISASIVQIRTPSSPISFLSENRHASDVISSGKAKDFFSEVSSPSEKLQTTPLTSPLSRESVSIVSSSLSTTSTISSASGSTQSIISDSIIQTPNHVSQEKQPVSSSLAEPVIKSYHFLGVKGCKGNRFVSLRNDMTVGAVEQYLVVILNDSADNPVSYLLCTKKGTTLKKDRKIDGLKQPIYMRFGSRK